jgi:hypothetical protein
MRSMVEGPAPRPPGQFSIQPSADNSLSDRPAHNGAAPSTALRAVPLPSDEGRIIGGS